MEGSLRDGFLLDPRLDVGQFANKLREIRQPESLFDQPLHRHAEIKHAAVPQLTGHADGAVVGFHHSSCDASQLVFWDNLGQDGPVPALDRENR